MFGRRAEDKFIFFLTLCLTPLAIGYLLRWLYELIDPGIVGICIYVLMFSAVIGCIMIMFTFVQKFWRKAKITEVKGDRFFLHSSKNGVVTPVSFNSDIQYKVIDANAESEAKTFEKITNIETMREALDEHRKEQQILINKKKRLLRQIAHKRNMKCLENNTQ